MRTLGIDPGMGATGYGVVEEQGNKLIPLGYGVIKTKANSPLAFRLPQIYTQLQVVINEYQRKVVAVEEVFLAHNVNSAFKLGEARGAAVLAAANCNLPLYEYSALVVKQAVVGYGRADKHQVQAMIQVLLNLKEIPEPNDAADALAVAVCHIQTARFKAKCQVTAK